MFVYLYVCLSAFMFVERKNTCSKSIQPIPPDSPWEINLDVHGVPSGRVKVTLTARDAPPPFAPGDEYPKQLLDGMMEIQGESDVGTNAPSSNFVYQFQSVSVLPLSLVCECVSVCLCECVSMRVREYVSASRESVDEGENEPKTRQKIQLCLLTSIIVSLSRCCHAMGND